MIEEWSARTPIDESGFELVDGESDPRFETWHWDVLKDAIGTERSLAPFEKIFKSYRWPLSPEDHTQLHAELILAKRKVR